MYVKGNPVLSKMYAHSGLTLNERGLYFFIKDDSRYNFMITEDHVKIAEIMGFDYVEFEGAKEYNDFFELLLTNQFFRPSVFLVDGCNGEVRMFKELSEFLSVRKVFKGYTKRKNNIPMGNEQINRFCKLVQIINEDNDRLEKLHKDFYAGGMTFDEIYDSLIDDLKANQSELTTLLKEITNK